MTGTRRGRPRVILTAGDTYGPWTIRQGDLRMWPTPGNHPGGRTAARCECTCGLTRVLVPSQLRQAARLGPDCPGHGHPGGGRKAKPRPQPPPPIPGGLLVPGLADRGWTIVRAGVQASGLPGLIVACDTCHQERKVTRATFAGHRTRPCTRCGTTPRRLAPDSLSARVLAWVKDSAPGRLVSSAEVAAALHTSTAAVGSAFGNLIVAGEITRPYTALFGLPGASRDTWPADPRHDKIRAFLAGDGGGTLAEIRRGTGLPAPLAVAALALMTERGEVVKPGPESFYLLSGQEPGEIVTLG